MGLLPIPAPKLTQGASRAGFWRAAALYGRQGHSLYKGGGGGKRDQQLIRHRTTFPVARLAHTAGPVKYILQTYD